MREILRDWIKSELRERDWSIRELANNSDMTHAYIAKILRGEKPITWNFCASMADAFDRPVWELFIMADLLEDVPKDLWNDEKTKVLVSSFNKLPEKDKDDVLDYIRWVKLKGVRTKGR